MLRSTFPATGNHVDDHTVLHRRGNTALWADDYGGIQAAIDAAVSNGKSNVVVPPGTWQINQTIQCAAGVALDFFNGATVRLTADVDAIRCAPRAHITGGKIDCSQVTFTKSALYLNGDDHFDTAAPTLIRDIRLVGKAFDGTAGAGKGIYFYSKQDPAIATYIYGVSFSNIGIGRFQHGIYMLVEEVAGATLTASINANMFNNIVFQKCDYDIYMHYIEAQTNSLLGIGGCTFSNIQIQPDANSLRALYCEGSHHLFSNFFVWDWWDPIVPEQYAIELTSRSQRNIINTNLRNVYYTDSGTTNKFITPDT